MCLLDVLEHIEEDLATLQAVGALLAPGGHAVITVPAYRWMWSAHDEFLHHKRRYTAAELRSKVSGEQRTTGGVPALMKAKGYVARGGSFVNTIFVDSRLL